MSNWALILKDLPDNKSLPGILTQDTAVNFIENQAKESPKGATRVARYTRRLAEGKEKIPDALKGHEDAIIANAKKISDILRELVTQANSESQPSKPSVDDKLDKIVAEKNKGALQVYVGTNPVRKWPNKTRTVKVKALKQAKDEILSFIEKDDLDLLYYDTSNFSRSIEIPDNDKDKQKRLAKLKEQLENYDVTITDTEITYPKKMTVRAFNDQEEIIASLNSVQNNPEQNVFKVLTKKQGKANISPLAELLELDQEHKVKEKVMEAENKDYSANVTSTEQVKDYLLLITGKGYSKVSIFMPKSTLKTRANKTTVVWNRIMRVEGKTTLSTALVSLLKASTFDLQTLAEEASHTTESKHIPIRVRRLLDESKSLKELGIKEGDDINGITTNELEDLREYFTRSDKQYKRFLIRIKNAGLTPTFDKLAEEGPTQNLFLKEEVDILMQQQGKRPRAIAEELTEFYGSFDRITADLLDKILDEAQSRKIVPFTEVSEGTWKLKIEGVTLNDKREFVQNMRNYRMKKYSEEVESDINPNQTHETLTTTFTQDYKPESSNTSSPADILYYLYLLDLYYGKTGFKNVVISFWRGNTELEEVLEKAKTEFTNIIDSLTQATNARVTDIINNLPKYQKKMVYKKKSRAYNIIKDLRQRTLIVEV